jgi:hypothetical protein
MLFSDDMKELLEIFEKERVKYMVVGGHAVNYYGYMRVTQDIDLLVYPSVENADAVMAALEEFGFGGAGIPRECFETEGSAIHLGVEPNRIDLLTSLKGVSLDQVFANAQRAEMEGVLVSIISRDDLLKAKRLSERLKDRADAEELERIGQQEEDPGYHTPS